MATGSGSSSLSPSPCPEESVPSGRRKSSPAWEYFVYDSETDKSICQIEVCSTGGDRAGTSSASDSNVKQCGQTVAGKWPTNLKHHLQKYHPKQYDVVLEKEKELKAQKVKPKVKKPTLSGQLTISQAFEGKPQYTQESDRYNQITKKLAIFIGSTNVAISLVDNAEFRSLLRTLDPRYPVPGRKLMGKKLDKLILEMKGNIQQFMSTAQRFSLCADIWSKKGLSSSYLGITAHFFARKDHQKHSVTLAVRKFPHPHTGERVREVVEEVLKEWDIPVKKIAAILTDNGSNMVKAFRMQVLSQVESDDEDGLEEDEEVDEDQPGTYEADLDDFVTQEIDHDVSFAMFIKRVSCMSHTLQLIVHKFSEVKSFKRVLASAHALVKKVNKSSVATEKLLSLCHRKLIGDCPTRWSSSYLMLQRLLSVRTPLSTVLDQLEWDNLPASDWKTIEKITVLLRPFAEYTSLVSGEEYTTISSVIPIIMELNLHLEEMKKDPETSRAASVLLSELKLRFKKFTDPCDPDHDSLFLLCTMLDPRYRLLLNRNQSDSTKENLLRQLKEQSESSGSSSNATQSPRSPVPAEEEPPTKRFCHLSRIIEQRLKEDVRKVSKRPPGEQEIEQYLSSGVSLQPSDDPISFWIQHEKNYPVLSPFAIDVLSIPGSSAPIERTFSTAGESSSGKRNRLMDKNLEREVLLRKNQAYLYV